MLSKEIQMRYEQWLNNPYFGSEIKAELIALTDKKEIEDRFYCDLEFSTSGVRGVLGAGTNRMNIYLVRKLTKAFARVICEQGSLAMSRGVVVSYDSRKFSKEFALETSLVLTNSGIKVYLFEDLRPTPELSFTIGNKGAIAGIMITASHNPKEYNGYKVYWEDGAQVSPSHAEKIMKKMKSCSWDIPLAKKEDVLDSGLLEMIGREVDDCYIACVQQEMLHRDLCRLKGKDLKIVYTPLHGTGKVLVERTLSELGFSSLFTVPEQALPDTEFSTVEVPNPESPQAWDLSLRYAPQENADLLLATDPDSDRLGVQCRNGQGEYEHLTGNQVGILLVYYILSTQPIVSDGILLQSIVSTALTERLALDMNVPLIKVPVGFKFIGEQIRNMEKSGKGTFLFGFEESLGYLKGTYTRDKDAILGAALIAEAALYYKEKEGKTLPDVLTELFETYGYFLDEQVACTLGGKDGKEKIQQILSLLESDSRQTLGGQKIISREYYNKGQQLKDGALCPLDFPMLNMLGITFENGGFIKARPSGTEPKIRFYFCIAAHSRPQAEVQLAHAKEDFFQLIKHLL